MTRPTDDQIDTLINTLDHLARLHGGREYGLPTYTVPDDSADPLPVLRDAVRTWVAGLPKEPPVGPRTMSEMVKDACERLKTMTHDEKRAMMIRAGLLTADGKTHPDYLSGDDDEPEAD